MWRMLLMSWLAGLSASAVEVPRGWLNLNKLDFSIRLDVRYATKNNFTKAVVYPEAKCVLREEVALALVRVQAKLKLQQMGLKVFDCYRPLSIQKKFWELVPDERYVADPQKGSRHNRGAAVDVALVDLNGKALEMPSEYDDFSEKAHRNYAKASRLAKHHSRLLEKVMAEEGFIPFATEWWHFDFKDWEKYPIEDLPLQEFP